MNIRVLSVPLGMPKTVLKSCQSGDDNHWQNRSQRILVGVNESIGKECGHMAWDNTSWTGRDEDGSMP